MLRESPIVYAAEQDYQIVFRVTSPCLCTVRVGEHEFFDDNNGVMRSSVSVHRVTVPMAVLDAVGAYSVCLRPVTERKPYFTVTEEQQETAFAFRPVPSDNARAFHISDVHERVEAAIAAAVRFGAMDFLILNGDLANHNGHEDQADVLFTIASAVTKGEIPVVLARGNHDTRGAYAERFTACLPIVNGHTYYTFRLGGIMGVVLDCGEDKPDSHEEYGHTACFHAFRERETQFLETVGVEKPWDVEGVHTRLVIVHNPFTHRLKPPFDIEEELYRRWAVILKERLRPDLMLCGHLHQVAVHAVGEPFDHLGQPCPLVVGGQPQDDGFAGAGFEFSSAAIRVCRVDSDGGVMPLASFERG